jgi:hypothetical protein
MANGLDKWFKQNWVDIRSKKNGMYQPCGRQKGSGRKYPKCVPQSVLSGMSESEKRSAIQRKIVAERKSRRNKKPNYAKTFAN